MDLEKHSVSLEDYIKHRFTSKNDKQTLRIDTLEDELGINVINYRRKHHLTQVQLSQLAGITQPSIARIENGYDSKLSTIVKLANAFNVNIKKLIPA